MNENSNYIDDSFHFTDEDNEKQDTNPNTEDKSSFSF